MSAFAGVAHAESATDGPTSEACASFQEFIATACPLTWHGITIYGAYDVGVGWVSHGLPENGYNYEGESLVNRNGNNSRFVLAPNNMQQTGLGLKGKIEFMRDWYAVFNASTGINPQSGQLANMAATNTTNNGLPRSSYSETGDGARAGQAFNDELYGGVSSTYFGTLTFGRQRATSCRTTSVFRRNAPSPPVSAVPARARSTKSRCTWIITSPSVSTFLPALPIPRSAAACPSPFLTDPASPTITTT